MATEQGVRFALAGLPTPGSGLDEQDRYAIGGVVLSFNASPPPPIGADFASKQRAANAGVILPDGALDEQDRYNIAGVIQPAEGTVIDASKRFFLGGAVLQPQDGFTPNDRQAISGVYPTGDENQLYIERFDLDYELRSTISGLLLPSANDGSATVLLGGFRNVLQASSVDITPSTILIDGRTAQTGITLSVQQVSLTTASVSVNISGVTNQIVGDITTRSILISMAVSGIQIQ